VKILFCSYQSISFMKGGPTYKILMLKKHLEKFNIIIDLFNQWEVDSVKNYDIVHIFNAHSGVYHFAQSLKLNNIKYIVNPIFFSKHSPMKIRLYLYFLNKISNFLNGTISEISIVKEVCKNAELIMPNTIEEENIIKKGLGLFNYNYSTIYNGVEKRFLYSDPSLFIKKYKIKDFILHVGHIGAKRKNTLRLLKALKTINYPTVIIGNVLNNKEGQKCLELIKENTNILFLDWVKHSDPLLESAYAASKVFVLPSLYETPGRSALEAGLAKSNIVITPFGGTKEYFSNYATYVNPYSIKKIQESIINSINSNRSDNLSIHIKQNFLWEIIAKKLKTEYEKLLTL